MAQLFNSRNVSPDKMVWSKEVAWNVHLDVDNRGNVTRVSCMCFYGQGSDPTTGYITRELGPFEVLHDAINLAMVDAAAVCYERLNDHLDSA